MKNRLIAGCRAGLFLIAAAMLAGCAGDLATLRAEATYVLGAGIDIAHRTHDKRRTVEDLCWISVLITVAEIRGDDNKSEADVRRFLRRVYPRLLTLKIIQQYLDDPRGILSEPPGCPDEELAPGTPPGETPSGPPLIGAPVEEPLT
jgi:hypothetical protein